MTEQSGFDLKVFGPFSTMLEPFVEGLDAVASNAEMKPGSGVQLVASQMNKSVKALARCQLETMGLVNRRMQAWLDVPAQLARCRTPQDVFIEQTWFWRTACAQYAESTGKVMSLLSEAVPTPAFEERARKPEHDYIDFSEPAVVAQPPKKPAVSRQSHQQRRVA